ncbi:MAG: hypothetical protein ACR2RE_27420 [Geminicoccaceae bacterium]
MKSFHIATVAFGLLFAWAIPAKPNSYLPAGQIICTAKGPFDMPSPQNASHGNGGILDNYDCVRTKAVVNVSVVESGVDMVGASIDFVWAKVLVYAPGGNFISWVPEAAVRGRE